MTRVSLSAWLAAALVVVALSVGPAAADPVPGWNNTNDLGQTPEFMYEPLKLLGRSLHTFNNTHGFFKAFIQGFETVFVLNCTEAARLILEEHKLIEAAWPNTLKAILGQKGIIFTKGWKKWGRARHNVEAAFGPNVLAAMIPSMTTRVAAYATAWSTSATPVMLYQQTRALVFDCILGFLFGKTYTPEQYTRLHDYYTIIDDGSLTITLDTPYTTWGKAIRADAKLRAFILPEVQQKIDDIASGVPENPPTMVGSLVKAMLDEGVYVEDLDFEEILDAAVGYFFGGYVTVSQTIARIMWELPKQPAYLQKVLEEQSNLIKKFGKKIDKLEVLNNMPYLDGLIKESVRIQAPVGAVFRQALVDFEAGGYTVQKGQHIILLLQPSCNNPHFFPNTAPTDNEEFKPERWIAAACTDSAAKAKTEETAKIQGGCPVKHAAKDVEVPDGCPTLVPNPPAMMSFGGGPRQCPGRYWATSIIKNTLSQILRSATWERAVDIPVYIHPDTAKLASVTFTSRALPASATAKACPGISFWPAAPGKFAGVNPTHAEPAAV